MFSEQDKNQIKEHKLNVAIVEKQIERFKIGFPFIDIKKAASIEAGITQLDEKTIDKYIAKFEEEKSRKTFAKFVPASGAATRMFKRLFEFLREPEGEESKKDDFYSVKNYFKNIKDFAFFDDLKLILLNTPDHFENLLKKEKYVEILNAFISEDGLGYGFLPKGLLKFHKYQNFTRTAVEEHLVEGAQYACTSDNNVRIHFTVSPQFIEEFKSHIEQIREDYEKKFGLKYDVDFSVQESYTDTIAVDENNQPFRNDKGQLTFRPAGHGAILENLNRMDNDIIFIKNIDNVVPDIRKDATIKYKKALAGVLIEIQDTIFALIKELQNSNEESILKKIEDFLSNKLTFTPCDKYATMNSTEKRAYLFSILNRPIRVCGMVKNEGEPGGGPFIVREKDGSCNLQIIESAQINKDDKTQAEIAQTATHFNPVDIICGIKNYKGEKFNLKEFVNEEAGIITKKSQQGRSLKALELPGLWNGSMANWNTIFVEVPIATFNPVKEINDLLRKEHTESVISK